MKVLSLKNFELADSCPVCGSKASDFARYVNGAQCKSVSHNGRDLFFITRKGFKAIYKLEVIDNLNSIEFNYENNLMKLTQTSDEDIELPIFNMEVNEVCVKTFKELLIFN